MRIDGLVNYSSYMQHFNPLDARPVQDAAAKAGGEQQKPEASAAVQKPQPAKEQGAQEGVVYRKAAQEIGKVGSVSSYREPLEDIQIDFGKSSSREEPVSGISTGDIKKAISGMAQDSSLHGYQYFVGSGRAETLVNNEDGQVLKLGA